MAGASQGGTSALRVLESAREEVEALRSGSLSPSAARGHILRVANTVDRALRRLLRDDDEATLDLRLKALAPDELRIDTVLAELRRGNRLPMELAASIHDLLETRRRLEGAAEPQPGDAARAVSVAERLEPALRAVPVTTRERPTPPASAAPSPIPFDAQDDELEEVVEPTRPRRWRRATAAPIVGIAAGVLIGIAILVWLVRPQGPSEMEQGIALFESGQYEEAAQHFWRYGEANPDDVTPHLYLARIHRRLDRPTLAVEAIRTAERIAPQDPAVHRELGFLLLDTGQAAVSVERFERAIELDRASSEGWIGLVRALRESGRGDEVDAVIQQAPAEVRALLSSPTAN